MPAAVPNVETPQGIPPAASKAHPTLIAALDSLKVGLLDFINGATTVHHAPVANPGAGGPVMGSIGGYRDKILKNVSLTINELTTGISNLARTIPPVPIVVIEPSPDAKPGSISGTVVDSDGDPAANVLIAITSGAEVHARDIFLLNRTTRRHHATGRISGQCGKDDAPTPAVGHRFPIDYSLDRHLFGRNCSYHHR